MVVCSCGCIVAMGGIQLGISATGLEVCMGAGRHFSSGLECLDSAYKHFSFAAIGIGIGYCIGTSAVDTGSCGAMERRD